MAAARKPDDPNRVPVELPLPKFLDWAMKRNQAHYDAQQGQRLFLSPLFEFVRCLKAYPELESLTATEAFRRLRAIPWLAWFPDSDDPEIEFLATWDKVRVPAGRDILKYAAALAGERPLTLSLPITENYSLFLGIAFQLQLLRPSDYINLPVARLGTILGVGTRAVSHYTDRAKKDGYLKLIARHYVSSHQAAKYTFACERFDVGTGEELKPKDSNHFHKDSKDSEDSKDLKDSDDPEEISRTEKEPQRQEGLSGLTRDFKRPSGLSRGVFSVKNSGISVAERRKELQEQRRFLEGKKTATK